MGNKFPLDEDLPNLSTISVVLTGTAFVLISPHESFVLSSRMTNYVLSMLKQAQVPEKQILEFIHTVKSDLGVDLSAIGLGGSYRTIPYGSAVTGLFTNGSDLDLFVYCGEQVGRKRAIAMVQQLAEVMRKRTRAKNLLYRNVVTMCNGRVPVLKCHHIGLNREININFTSHTGVNNSFLIKHLVTMDARIRPMMVLLKIYFKLKLGANSMTTFNLYSLIIFALQNATDPVLPPLSTFLVNRKDAVLVENRWPVQFQCRTFEKTKNCKTLIELILGFCSFYAEFDFANRLVSPYMGNQQPIVTKDNYASFEEFACSDHAFKFDRVMNVQDFFVLCVNLGSNCEDFQKICQMHHKHRAEYEKMTDDEALGRAFFARSE